MLYVYKPPAADSGLCPEDLGLPRCISPDKTLVLKTCRTAQYTAMKIPQ